MIKKIGTTFLAKITSQPEMDEFVAGLEIKSNTVIIKPNWVEARMGAHTDAKVLDMFLIPLMERWKYRRDTIDNGFVLQYKRGIQQFI